MSSQGCKPTCADCHSGKLLGGEPLEKFGVHAEYWTLTKSMVHDERLFESSKSEADKFHFSISMLRNIEKTGPYFHDGSIQDPKVAVRIVAKLQLDQNLDDLQVDSIVAFLSSLTGEIPKNYKHPDFVHSKQ